MCNRLRHTSLTLLLFLALSHYFIVYGSMCTIRSSCRRLSHVWAVVKLKWLKWFKSNLFVKTSAFLLLLLLTILDTLCDGPFNFDRNNSLSPLELLPIFLSFCRKSVACVGESFNTKSFFPIEPQKEKMKRVQKKLCLEMSICTACIGTFEM